MKNSRVCTLRSVIPMAARLTPTGNPRPTSTCSPAGVMSGLTTIRSSKRANTGWNNSAWSEGLLSSSRTKSASKKLRNIFAHLVLPIRPVVAALRAPIVQQVPDSLAGKNFREAVRGSTVLPRARAGGNVNVATGNLLVEPGIARVGKVIDRIVEIEIVIVHAIHEVPQGVNSRHCESALHHIGMLVEAGRTVV